MIKTIILLVIVFYTFPCQKINAQSRDTSNIFAGYYIAVYNKSDLSHKKIRRHHKHSYNTAIDSRYRTYFIPIVCILVMLQIGSCENRVLIIRTI